MSNKVYLAFINDYFPAGWKRLSNDLKHCAPFPFDFIQVRIDLSLFFDSDRNQYHSTLLLSQVLKALPVDGSKIVGITQVDIYIPIFTFVFGEAQLGGAGAIVSTFRLHDEFYGLPPNPLKFYSRTYKEILHELGHTMGLIHCSDFRCVMYSSTYVEDIDIKGDHFCKNCQEVLGVNCEEI